MIRKHTRRAAKAAFAISFGVAIILGGATAATAGSAQSTATPIIVGTKNFGEAFVLGELYKQALEAKGFDVSYKENIGSTELIQKALTSGKITLYPEYVGIAYTVTFKKKTFPASAQATYGTVKRLYAGKGYTVLQDDAVPGRRRRRGAPHDRAEVRPEVRRRPEEGARPDARRLPRVPHAGDRARRDGEEVRHHRRQVHAARRDQRLQAARRRQGARRRRVLDRPAARDEQVRRPEGSEEHLRVPERRPDRLEQAGVGVRPEAHVDAERGQLRS